MCCAVAQSCLTLCDPMDCSLPGSSAHGILEARILEWVARSSSRGSSQPRDRTQVYLGLIPQKHGIFFPLHVDIIIFTSPLATP